MVEMVVFTNPKVCPPCRAVAPILEDLKSDGYNIRIVDTDVGENALLANQQNINAIPTFIIYKDNSPVARFSGARNKQSLVQAFDV